MWSGDPVSVPQIWSSFIAMVSGGTSTTGHTVYQCKYAAFCFSSSSCLTYYNNIFLWYVYAYVCWSRSFSWFPTVKKVSVIIGQPPTALFCCQAFWSQVAIKNNIFILSFAKRKIVLLLFFFLSSYNKNKKLFNANCDKNSGEKRNFTALYYPLLTSGLINSSLNYQPEYNWTNQWLMRRKRCQLGSEFSCNENRNLLAGLLMISAAGWPQQFSQFH